LTALPCLLSLTSKRMDLRTGVRTAARRIAPAYMADRARRYEARIRERDGVSDAVARDLAEHGDLVRAGSLKGMRYPKELLLDAHMPLAKIAGVYEKELDPYFAESMDALRAQPLFLDLGCSDGYYAAGVGRASGAAVVAFDIAPSARKATEELCAVNEVDCECRGAASTSVLCDLGPRAGLVLCDIEGAEIAVFSPETVKPLTHTRLIIETHEPMSPGVEKVLVGRFADSHSPTFVDLVSDVVWKPGFSEGRAAGVRWLVLDPIAS
jgi:SAM-dependent methyltransferase